MDTPASFICHVSKRALLTTGSCKRSICFPSKMQATRKGKTDPLGHFFPLKAASYVKETFSQDIIISLGMNTLCCVEEGLLDENVKYFLSSLQLKCLLRCVPFTLKHIPFLNFIPCYQLTKKTPSIFDQRRMVLENLK